MFDYGRVAVNYVLREIRSGATLVTATAVQNHVLARAALRADPLAPVQARQVGICVLKRFASIGIGEFKKGVHGHDTRLQRIP